MIKPNGRNTEYVYGFFKPSKAARQKLESLGIKQPDRIRENSEEWDSVYVPPGIFRKEKGSPGYAGRLFLAEE
jgi:hypothetical protein